MVRTAYQPFGHLPIRLKEMQDADLEQLVEEVLFVSRALFGVTIRSITSVSGEITLLQYRTLVVLASRGPQRMAELREELGTQAPAVTRLCNRLAERGLVERQPIGGTRELEVCITAKGAQLIEDVFTERRRELVRIVDSIAPERRDEVKEALQLLGKATGEPRDLPWSAAFLS